MSKKRKNKKKKTNNSYDKYMKNTIDNTTDSASNISEPIIDSPTDIGVSGDDIALDVGEIFEGESQSSGLSINFVPTAVLDPDNTSDFVDDSISISDDINISDTLLETDIVSDFNDINGSDDVTTLDNTDISDSITDSHDFDISDSITDSHDFDVSDGITDSHDIDVPDDVINSYDIGVSDDVINSDDTNISDNISSSDEQSSSFAMVKKNNKKWPFILIPLIVIAFLVLVFSTIFGLLNIGNTKIIGGTYISGIDVSGLSKEEALEKVSSAFSEKLSSEIVLKHNDYETSVFAEQFEISFDINSAVETAYNKGRNGNIFENNFSIINSYFSKVNINPSFSYSDDSILALITEIEPNLPDRAIQPSYYIEGNNLIVSKGSNGIRISSDEFKIDIIYYFNNLLYKDAYIEIPVENVTVSNVDINKIHEEIYKAPQDAYFTSNPYVVHPHVDGVDFAISIEEASALLTGDGESCTIPLKVLSPSVTTSKIGPEAFPNLLAEFSTTYSSSNYNRSTNIALAASKIDGIVIMPGEVFSYNQTVGKRTAAAGFKSAGVYVNGQVSTDIGGGICQVSSTLYNAVLLANLEIVERTNHYFNPGYVEAGKDATVSWGGPDFKFKNNRNYPIKIVCSGTGGRVHFKIWGLFSDDEYEVSVESKYIQSIPYKTVRRNDSSLAKGATKVIESGSNGCKTETYRILKKNGTVVSRTLLSRDTYNPHNRVIAVGN